MEPGDESEVVLDMAEEEPRAPHRCHANGCLAEAHPELPLCKKHFQLLPEPHRKKLWDLRWPAKRCPVCEHQLSNQAKDQWKDYRQWFDLANLAIVIVCRLEYGEHDCPPDLLDDQGFCWGCGTHGVPKSWTQADEMIKRFSLKAA